MDKEDWGEEGWQEEHDGQFSLSDTLHFTPRCVQGAVFESLPIGHEHANLQTAHQGGEREVRRLKCWTPALPPLLQHSAAKCNFPLRLHRALPKPTGPLDSTNTPSINSSTGRNATGTGRNSSPGKVCTQGMSRPILRRGAWFRNK